MAKGCRDCKRCTESVLTRLVKKPVRVTQAPIGIVTAITRKKCPHCGHNVADHELVDGRFKD